MRIRYKVGAALLSTVALGAPLGAAATASAVTTPISVKCEGVSNDVAGTVSGAPKSSKEMLDLAGKLVSMPSLPPFPTTVTTDAPDKLAINSGDREVTLTYSIGVPAQVAALVRDTLGVPKLTASNTVAGVRATLVDAVAQATAPDTTLDFNDPNTSITVTMKVKVTTTKSGRIFYRPTPISMELQVNATVAGIANIGKLTLACDAQGVITTTAIQVKGTPNVPAEISGGTVVGGSNITIPLIGRSDILEDDNNPILPETLRVVEGANGAYIVGGALVQPTSAAGGSYSTGVELCAAPRMTLAEPGTNEVQTLKFPSAYPVKDGFGIFNPHPLGMKLTFNGEQTAEIPLSTKVLGTEVLGAFLAPSAGTIQRALEDLPSVDPGDIRVVRVDETGYEFVFQGKYAETDQPVIELSDWRTQLDYSAYDTIFEAIQGLAGGGGTPADAAALLAAVEEATPDPSATDMTLEQLLAELEAGRITVDVFFAKFGSALKNTIIKGLPISDILDALEQIFPQKPQIETKTDSERTIPAESTGPLCTTFYVLTTATPAETVIGQDTRKAGPCKVSGRTVKVRVKTVRTVRGKKRTSYRTVKVVRTVKSGGCPQAIVLRGGKLVITNLAVGGSKKTSQPKKVTITVTAKGVAGKASKTLTISRKTAAASGQLTLPASLAGAKRITVRISGSGVAGQARTLMPS